jgi:hypothetical protein
MKKLILGIFLIAGTTCLHAQDSTKHKMQQKKTKSDSTMHHKMGKMKKDSTKA